ncbi:MAG TPA: tetratricopeptide repeat protein [Candidatus Angelobacter sp.]|nr:tetratricopeptide repeat protein [Candidatus Angelobacter sp.]
MRSHEPRKLFLLPLVLLLVCSPLTAQTNADASDRAGRQRAMALFSEGKRLEALPLLEWLAQKDPKDSDVLVALAASLIDHAATLTDPDITARERFRARNLLQRAFELGNSSPLEENLRQLLEELPANGAIKFSDNPEVEQAMNAGEAAFARRDFDEALKDYSKALDLEPSNYPAALFTANTYDKRNNFPKAGEWYERAIQLDPNIETAYRYYADMLAKQGDMAKARSMLIHAAVAEPYNKIVWREIRAWATVNHTAFNIVFVAIPLPQKAAADAGKQPAELLPAWRTYYSVKDDWKKGSPFQKQFPQEQEYRHSLPEESEALAAAAQVLDKLKQDPKTSEHIGGDPSASLLLKLRDAGLLDAYVLFSLGDDEIAKDYVAYRAANRDKLEAYMDKFVMPPAPPKH